MRFNRSARATLPASKLTGENHGRGTGEGGKPGDGQCGRSQYIDQLEVFVFDGPARPSELADLKANPGSTSWLFLFEDPVIAIKACDDRLLELIGDGRRRANIAVNPFLLSSLVSPGKAGTPSIASHGQHLSLLAPIDTQEHIFVDPQHIVQRTDNGR